jgi:hypothetical protein
MSMQFRAFHAHGGVEKHHFGVVLRNTKLVGVWSCCTLLLQGQLPAAVASCFGAERLILKPTRLMPEHQHSWANMNKKLLLLLDPTGLCSSTSTVGQTRTKSCCCF